MLAGSELYYLEVPYFLLGRETTVPVRGRAGVRQVRPVKCTTSLSSSSEFLIRAGWLTDGLGIYCNVAHEYDNCHTFLYSTSSVLSNREQY